MQKSKHLKDAYLGIILLGIVSLMGDVVYEGARGIVPSYLEFLGASYFVVGLAFGLGDFLGYSLRLLSGFLADATRAYWVFIFLGYGLIVSIPFLGFSTSLEIAIILVLLERLGKAFRSPSRDTVLSVISKGIGAGKAFGIHELLDQIGAIIGPLMVAFLMFSSDDYHYTFKLLFIPFVILLTALTYTFKRIGAKTIIEGEKAEGRRKGRLEKPFYIYTLAVLLNTVGLITYALILGKASEILKPSEQQWIVPLIYLLIQGVDASVALIAGYSYDKFGIKVLTIPFILSIFPSLLVMGSSELSTIMIAAVFAGLVLGMQESIYRAAVSELTPIYLRGTAYGIFNTAYGVGFLISGAIYGFLMDVNAPLFAVAIYTFVTQLIATVFLLKVSKVSKGKADLLNYNA
ncbi:MFS transporter [Candidatus Bathyarchaeota archaeon]|nr:MAG: MFS transporter [Candidatus Bathyarchaeota archaeon]